MSFTQRQKGPNLLPRNYKSTFVNDKIELILPELLERNIKLTDRLKGKLKVSSFLNNTENRNEKYIKIFLSSSYKRVKDIKTGLELKKAVRQSKKNLENICNKINNDIILQNSDYLNEEKKLLKENTEQETHMKINKLLLNLKNTLKHVKMRQKTEEKNNNNYLNKSYMNNLKNYINNKLDEEKSLVNEQINEYVYKLKNYEKNMVSSERKKELKSYVDRMNIQNLKLLNYIKPKPIPIKDKECSSMARIKNNLYPYMNQSNKNIKKNIINLKSNMRNKNINKSMNNFSFNENGESKILDNNSFQVLKSLASNGENLGLKINKSCNKLNSLIDYNLPNPQAYNEIINNCRQKSVKKKEENIDDKKNLFYDPEKFDEIIKDEKLLDKHLSNKKKLEKIVNTIRNEVNKVKNMSIKLNHQETHKSKIPKKIIDQKKLMLNFSRLKKYKMDKEKSEKDEKSNDNKSTSVLSKRIDNNSQMIYRNKKDGDSSIFSNNDKNSESYSMREYKYNKNKSFLK